MVATVSPSLFCSIDLCHAMCCISVFLVRDGKVRKSVERIFTIWEERSVYSEDLIAQFKSGLNKKEREREREKEKQKEKEKEREREKEKEREKQKETQPPPGWFATCSRDVFIMLKGALLYCQV